MPPLLAKASVILSRVIQQYQPNNASIICHIIPGAGIDTQSREGGQTVMLQNRIPLNKLEEINSNRIHSAKTNLKYHPDNKILILGQYRFLYVHTTETTYNLFTDLPSKCCG